MTGKDGDAVIVLLSGRLTGWWWWTTLDGEGRRGVSRPAPSLVVPSLKLSMIVHKRNPFKYYYSFLYFLWNMKRARHYYCKKKVVFLLLHESSFSRYKYVAMTIKDRVTCCFNIICTCESWRGTDDDSRWIPAILSNRTIEETFLLLLLSFIYLSQLKKKSILYIHTALLFRFFIHRSLDKDMMEYYLREFRCLLGDDLRWRLLSQASISSSWITFRVSWDSHSSISTLRFCKCLRHSRCRIASSSSQSSGSTSFVWKTIRATSSLL